MGVSQFQTALRTLAKHGKDVKGGRRAAHEMWWLS